MENHPALFWLLLNFLTIIILSFYSMLEMAAVSFNKVRLQYYVSKGIKQAIWLNYLLNNPSKLFGTTLILVNIATVSGSEFAREFHQAIGINPDFSVISQATLVIIFGELAPMFAARRYPEHVVMLGIPLVYASMKLMTPFLFVLGVISKTCNFLIGGNESETKIFLTQEELLKILESQEDENTFSNERREYDTVATNILNLHKKDAKEIMSPLDHKFMIASNATISQCKKQLSKTHENYLVMFHQNSVNIIGIIFPRDLIRISDTKKARDSIQAPWFITESTKVSELLNQFRTNNKNVAVVLDKKGLSSGIINLDDVMEEVFGETRKSPVNEIGVKSENQFILERTFWGNLTLREFKDLYDIALNPDLDLTLSELIKDALGSHPEVGESIYIEPFEITVEEISLLDIRKVSIHTRLK